MPAAQPKAQGEKLVAVNMNAGGKIHRLSLSNAARPRDKRRAICGWWAGSAVSKTFFCKSAVAANLCGKCFRQTSKRPSDGELEDAIEDFGDV